MLCVGVASCNAGSYARCETHVLCYALMEEFLKAVERQRGLVWKCAQSITEADIKTGGVKSKKSQKN